MTDIHLQWKALMGRNACEIMAFTTALVKEYWRVLGIPRDISALDGYRRLAMSGDYRHLISVSLEFILEQTDIQLDNSYLIR